MFFLNQREIYLPSFACHFGFIRYIVVVQDPTSHLWYRSFPAPGAGTATHINGSHRGSVQHKGLPEGISEQYAADKMPCVIARLCDCKTCWMR
jgi:hypothetical protein